MDSMPCIYCAGRQQDDAMSHEHIWPQSLGGASSPALFQSRNVCKTCNSLAGLWVDGAFLKSWFVSQEVGMAARQYLDPLKPGIAPIAYIGEDREFPHQPDHVCERWLGPAGDHIYHVHLKDNDSWYGYAGGDLIRRKKSDPGRAYLFITSQSTYWVLTSLQSFIAAFKRARLFCLTRIVGLPTELERSLILESHASTVEATEIGWIRARPEREHQHRISLRLDFSDRFLAKLCLGLGANLFGSPYCESPYAEELRKLLWFRPGSGDRPKIRGMNFWQEAGIVQVNSLPSLSGAWTILLQARPEGFALRVCTPGGRGMTMGISDDSSYWSSPAFESYRQGALYFVIPERQTFAGPVLLPQFLAHGNGDLVEPTLAKLQALKVDPAILPRPR